MRMFEFVLSGIWYCDCLEGFCENEGFFLQVTLMVFPPTSRASSCSG
jgi:hypothetical protein